MNNNLLNFNIKRNQLLKNHHSVRWHEPETERQFNFVSAELLNFLPEIPFAKHHSIFENILLNVGLSKLEREYPRIIKSVLIRNFSTETQNYIRNKPCIFCAWHFGAYRLINHFIAQKRIPYFLVVSRQILQSEGRGLSETFKRQYPDNKMLQIVDAESPAAGLRILKLIKQGYSALFYIDGNTGTGNTCHSANNCCIEFLGSRMYARKGVAFLSHLSETPILPVISYRDNTDQNTFSFHDLIFPDLALERDEFAINCTQMLYNFFAPGVKRYPGQWEAWLYLYKVLKSNDTKLDTVKSPDDDCSKRIILNTGFYGVFRWKEECYLFNKRNYTSFPINRDIYDFLKETASGNADVGRLDKNLFGQLFTHRVLVRAN